MFVCLVGLSKLDVQISTSSSKLLDDLKEVFEKYGKIEKCRLVRDIGKYS